jgi:hypothetical protein
MPFDERLLDAYLRTTFFVNAPRGRFGIRIGETCPQLDKLLAQHDASTWAYVTACNPQSRRAPESQNAERQAALLVEVIRAGYITYNGEGVGDDPQWPPEASLLIVGICEQDALALGRRFDQKAIVVGCAGRAARLVWC